MVKTPVSSAAWARGNLRLQLKCQDDAASSGFLFWGNTQNSNCAPGWNPSPCHLKGRSRSGVWAQDERLQVPGGGRVPGLSSPRASCPAVGVARGRPSGVRAMLSVTARSCRRGRRSAGSGTGDRVRWLFVWGVPVCLPPIRGRSSAGLEARLVRPRLRLSSR